MKQYRNKEGRKTLDLSLSDGMSIHYSEPLESQSLEVSIRKSPRNGASCPGISLAIWADIPEILVGMNNIEYQIELSGRLKAVIDQLCNNQYDGFARDIFIRGKILEIIATVIASNGKDNDNNSMNSVRNMAILEKAKSLLKEQFWNPPSIANLANSLHTSPRTLNTIFRQNYGMTVFEWLSQARLEEAGKLLRDHRLSIKEVSATLGYSHPNNFINAFTRKYGVSPGRYRNEGE